MIRHRSDINIGLQGQTDISQPKCVRMRNSTRQKIAQRILDPRAHVSPPQRVSKQSQTYAEEKSSGFENQLSGDCANETGYSAAARNKCVNTLSKTSEMNDIVDETTCFVYKNRN